MAATTVMAAAAWARHWVSELIYRFSSSPRGRERRKFVWNWMFFCSFTCMRFIVDLLEKREQVWLCGFSFEFVEKKWTKMIYFHWTDTTAAVRFRWTRCFSHAHCGCPKTKKKNNYPKTEKVTRKSAFVRLTSILVQSITWAQGSRRS